MKSLKMFGIAGLATLIAMAFVVSSAMAEETQLCTGDPSGSCGNVITHVHVATLPGSSNQATLLNNVLNVKCDVLFLGDSLGLGAPLVIHGNFTYSNCTSGCEVFEVSEDSLIEVLKLGHETADVTGEGEVRVHCGIFINCLYNGEGLNGTAKGPLLSSETNGSVSISGQAVNKVEGVCPTSLNKLDIVVTPLIATYISS